MNNNQISDYSLLSEIVGFKGKQYVWGSLLPICQKSCSRHVLIKVHSHHWHSHLWSAHSHMSNWGILLIFESERKEKLMIDPAHFFHVRNINIMSFLEAICHLD